MSKHVCVRACMCPTCSLVLSLLCNNGLCERRPTKPRAGKKEIQAAGNFSASLFSPFNDGLIVEEKQR